MSVGAPFIPGLRQYRISVAGTDPAAVTALVGPRRQERLHIQVRAQLARQDDDFEVSIQGYPVGRLSRAAAQAFDRITRYGNRSPHEIFECGALISGTVGNYSVRLDLPLGDD